MEREIAIVTANRAEYGLLYPLIMKMEQDIDIKLKLIVTGAHLSKDHGYTVDFIRKDGFTDFTTVDLEIIGDREEDICNVISRGIDKFSNVFKEGKLDAIILLGDRYEMFAVAVTALTHRIPIIHIHGGEITKGAMDESIRHAITKLASIHFPSLDIYRKRIIQMGELPERVHTVGALGIDNIKNMKLMNKEILSQQFGLDFYKKIALVTYHPVTLDSMQDAEVQIKELLEALLKFDFKSLITMPNADAGGMHIFNIIQRYANKYSEKIHIRKSLGQVGYLSAMEHASIMVGNTSSGIIESASFKIPVVNIGDRQEGRCKPPNIINCKCNKEEIITAISTGLSEEFKQRIKYISNPYGDGNTAERILSIIKNIDFENKENLIKKSFYNIDFI